MNNTFYRVQCAFKFGGVSYCVAVLKDILFHTKIRRAMTIKIVKDCTKENIEKKAIAYVGLQSGKKVNISYPKTFNEKILWYMLNDSNEKKAELTDKYTVRKYVKNKIGEKALVPLLGVWDSFDDIDFNNLPDRFVLKCNHGSGMNAVIKDKSKINYEKLKKEFDLWMHSIFAYNNFEMHYAKIIPKIIAEEYIEEMDGNLFDYKVHCFNGVPTFIQMIGNRNFSDHSGKQLIYDFNWNKQKYVLGPYPKYSNDLQKPVLLKELYEYSDILCKGFEYVRADFYIIGETIYFGELTFTPGGGLYVYNRDFTYEDDLKIGNIIRMGNFESKEIT